MCGIFGFAGQSTWKTSILLQSLCIADETRGKDSTGMVIQGKEGCLFKKKALRGRDFVGEGFTEFLFQNEYQVAMGHNRQATTGEVNDRNAHPFGFRVGKGWCFGLHNGVIQQKREIAREFGIEEPAVDSEVAFWAIAKLVNGGMELSEGIVNVTKTIDSVASYAFAYLDTAKQDIYLWRNVGRPIIILDARKLGLGRWFASTTDIFASAWQPLRGALGSIAEVTYLDAKPHRLYRLNESGILQVVTDIDIPKPEKTLSEPYKDWKLPEDETDFNQTDLFIR